MWGGGTEVSCSLRWFIIHYVAKTRLKLLILLPFLSARITGVLPPGLVQEGPLKSPGDAAQ